MVVNQQDVYYLPFPLEGKVGEHPFIVLSAREANQYQNTFVGVMITTSEIYHDEFSFTLNDHMFDRPLSKPGSHVRMHLLTLHLDRNVRGRRIAIMKALYFRQLMKTIGEMVFNYEFNEMN